MKKCVWNFFQTHFLLGGFCSFFEKKEDSLTPGFFHRHSARKNRVSAVESHRKRYNISFSRLPQELHSKGFSTRLWDALFFNSPHKKVFSVPFFQKRNENCFTFFKKRQRFSARKRTKKEDAVASSFDRIILRCRGSPRRWGRATFCGEGGFPECPRFHEALPFW